MKKSLLVANLAVITANVLGMNNLQQQSNKSNNKRLVTVSDSQLNDSKESTNQIMDPHNKQLSEVPAKEPEECESELDELAKKKCKLFYQIIKVSKTLNQSPSIDGLKSFKEQCEQDIKDFNKLKKQIPESFELVYKMVTKMIKYRELENIIIEEETILENSDKKRLDLIKESMEGLDKDNIAEIINENGGSLIFAALNYDHMDIVLFLLKQEGVNVNVKNKDGNTLLHLACLKGERKDMVELLINLKDEAGNYVVDVNEKNKNRYTPLHYACASKECKDIVELLINLKDEAGNYVVNFNEKNNNGNAPLHIACLRGERKDIVELLINLKDEAGNYVVDVNEKNKDGNTSLHLACMDGKCKDIVELLINLKDAEGNYVVDVNIKNNNGNIPLYIACYIKNKNLVKLLLERGAKIDKTILALAKKDLEIDRIVNAAKKGSNPRKKPTINNIKELQKELQNEKQQQSIPTKKMSGTNSSDKKGNKQENRKQNNERSSSAEVYKKTKNSIFTSISEDSLDQIKKLLKETPGLINEINEYGRTPIVSALAEKKFDTAQFLLTQNEIDLTRKDEAGNSALMYAAKYKYPTIVEGILNKIGNSSGYILERNGEGKNSLELAMFKPNNFSKLKVDQKKKTLENRKKVMELLLKHLSPKEKSEEMFFAIKNHIWDMAEMILDSEADVTIKCGSIPPLILALKINERDNKDVKLAFIKKLIAKEGANPNAEDENGDTALSYIVSRDGEISSEYKEIVKLLLEKEVNIRDKDKQIIIDWARKAKDEVINELLEKYNLQSSQVEKPEEKPTVKNEERKQKYKVLYKAGLKKKFDRWGQNNPSVYKDIQRVIFNLSCNPYPQKMQQGGYRLESGEKVEMKTGNLSGAYSISKGDSDRILYSMENYEGKKLPYIYNLYGHYTEVEQKYGTLNNLRSQCSFDDPIFPENPDDEEKVSENSEFNEKTLQNDLTEMEENSELSDSLSYDKTEIISKKNGYLSDDETKVTDIFNDKGKNPYNDDITGESSSDFSEIHDQTHNIIRFLLNNNKDPNAYIEFFLEALDQEKQKDNLLEFSAK
ncbi:MAG: ankyrin repeat domain-containing protein [Alphaproteobacteria bacterium]|nr:ankyrin repeat domain-containing protein [Alphaproteobacteria bacterium]